MRNSVTRYARVVITAIVFAALSRVLHAETKRAVIVGINSYRTQELVSNTARTGTFPRMALKGKFLGREIGDLTASVNDAKSIRRILIERFGFQEQNIVLLLDGEATADKILTSLQRHLVDEAKPGDVSFFYYAGHGSLIRNISTDDPTGLDQTLVPADALRGTPDIRDKELVRIFRPAAQKGVRLTIIADSCHSGSIVRSSARAREVSADEHRYVEDRPEIGRDGKKPPVPEDMGALVLSAARSDQQAYEKVGDSGPHGVFTWALLQVLESVSPDERLDRIFSRVRAMTQSEQPGQEPVMAGRGRGEKTLLGEPSTVRAAVTAAVESVDATGIRLQGGSAIGLREHCILKRSGARAEPPTTRLEIAQVLGPASSMARIIGGSAEDVHPGDLFELERWVVPQIERLMVYVPQNAPPLSAVRAAMAEARKLAGVDWIEDPTERRPDAVLGWESEGWALQRGPTRIPLGSSFTVAQLKEAIGNGTKRFLFSVPPPPEVAQGLDLGDGHSNQGVQLVSKPNEAQYVLSGRPMDKGFAFAWTSQTGSEEEFAAITAARNRRTDGHPVGSLMPLRSDWIELEQDGAPKVSSVLTDFALGLARVKGWLQVQPPSEANPFPYHLAFRRVDNRKTVDSNELKRGSYEIYLKLERGFDRKEYVPLRAVYVFVIDSTGASARLYPRENGTKVFPSSLDSHGRVPDEISLDTIDVIPPYGFDTYVLLTSAEGLSDPSVLTFNGVQSGTRDGIKNGGTDPLTSLILGLQQGTRGAPQVPVNWSMERTIIHSSDN